MKFFDPNNPNEKKKMIAAAALGLGAILVLGYVLFGGSSKPSTNTTANKPSPTPRTSTVATTNVEPSNDDCTYCQPVVFSGGVPAVSEANRNIFSFYIPPPPTPTPLPRVPTPTPTPPPPMTANSLSPSNVYARTPTDFALQVSGDRFTPAVHIFVDGRDLPTRFISNAKSVGVRAKTL